MKKNSKINQKTFDYYFNHFKNCGFLEQIHLSGLCDITQTAKKRYQIASKILGVDTRTIQRWMSGATAHPCATLLLFNMSMGINQTGAFAGWRCINDAIITNTGETLNADIMGRLWLWRNERTAAAHEIAQLKREIDTLKRQSNTALIQHINDAANILNSVLDIKKAG